MTRMIFFIVSSLFFSSVNFILVLLSLAFKAPIQETSYNESKEEFCCNDIIERYSFLKRIPSAHSFLLVLTTMVSYVASYFGKELVFPRSKRGELKSSWLIL